jgi:hypothetical protein
VGEQGHEGIEARASDELRHARLRPPSRRLSGQRIEAATGSFTPPEPCRLSPVAVDGVHGKLTTRGLTEKDEARGFRDYHGRTVRAFDRPPHHPDDWPDFDIKNTWRDRAKGWDVVVAYVLAVLVVGVGVLLLFMFAA